MSIRKILVSTVIVAVIGFQTLASFQLTPGPVGESPFLWPFLDYPMYSIPHYPGDTIRRPQVYGVLGDSAEVRIEPSDLQLQFWLLQRGLIPGLVAGDTSRVRPYARRYAELHDRPLDGFRLYDRPVLVRPSGADRAGRELVTTLRFADGPVR